MSSYIKIDVGELQASRTDYFMVVPGGFLFLRHDGALFTMSNTPDGYTEWVEFAPVPGTDREEELRYLTVEPDDYIKEEKVPDLRAID